MMVHALAMWDRVRFAPPRDSGASVAAAANGVGPDGTPPGHGGDIPGKGHGKGGANGGGTVTPPSGTTPPAGSGTTPPGTTPPGTTPPGATPPGQGGTPPGQGGDNPGNGGGTVTPPSGTTPPGQSGDNPGVGSGGTPPGQGGDNPGNGNGGGTVTPPSGTTPPGQSGDNPGVGSNGTPPGQGGDNPGNGIGPDGTPPGQGGTPPGQGGNPGNGNQPVVTVADVVVGEDGTAWVTITLDQPSKHPIKIDYHTADGTATAGTDYQALAGQVQIPAGELSVTIQVPILADATDEAHETFLLQLTKATGATIGDGQAVITITDDDAPVTPPTLLATTDEDAGAFAIDLLDGVVDINGDQPWVINAGQLLRADGSALTCAVIGSTLTFDLNQLTDLPLGASEQVTLTYQVTDGSGTADRTLTVTVEGRNDAPAAIAIQHETLENVPTVNFAFQATDVDQGAVLTYEVLSQPDLGRVVNRLDGTFDFVAGEDFRFLKKGEPLVVCFSYLARDEHGVASQPTTATITVIGTNTDPIVNADFFAGTEDTQLHLSPASLLANDLDEDGDPLTVDWVGNAQGGTVAFDASGQVVFTPAQDVNGAVTFDYRVNDGRGGLVTQTVTIMLDPVNDAPVAAAVGASVGEDGPAVTVAFAGSDVDAGAALSYTVLTQPEAGSVVNNGDGTFAFDPTGAFDHLKVGEQAQVSFTYRVTDEQGASDDATATVTVTGINDAPVANLDRTATLRGSAKVILANDLLANDTDPEGDPLSLQEVFGATGGAVSYDPVSGEILFTPEAGFIGTGTFQYRIADGQGGSAVGTVEVRVITTQGNGNPIAVDDTLLGTCGVDTLVARDGGDTLIGGGGSDTFIGGGGDDTIITNGDDTVDGGGGTDRVEVVGGYGAVIDMGASNVEIVVGGAGGDTVTGGSGNDVIYGGGGDDVLWGGDGDNYISGGGGSDTVGFGGGIGGYGFSFGGGGGGGGGGGWGWGSGGFGWGGGGGGWGWTITGGGGSTYVTGVEWISFPGIDVQFDADGRPCAFRIYEDVPVVIPKGLLLGNDSDPDGDTLYIASVQEALNASVGLTANGDVSFLGAQDFNGITTFTYTVSDGNGGYDDALVTVYVRPVNDAPVVAAPLVVATDEDSPTPVAVNLLTGTSDVDGDTLSVTNFHQTGGRTAQFVRNGAAFTLDPRQFTGLKQGEVETLTFDWTVSDGWTHTPHRLTVTVDGINDAPVAKDDTLRVDQYRTLRVGYDVLIGNDVDVDGETLTMVTPIGTYATDLGGTAVFDGSTVLYTPKAGFWGADSVTYTIRDPQGVESTATIWLDVQPPSAPGDGWIWVNLTTGLARNQFGPIPFPDTAPDLTGTRFSDVLVGDANANTFAGMAGNDFLNGLGGIDTADYTASNAAVAVNLATGDGRGGHAEGDRVVNFENLIGSQYGDTLTGNLFANTLTGAIGDDTLEGGAGADVLDGGAGNDTAVYTGSAAGVVVSLADGTGLAGDAQGDTLVSIENLTGSAYADRLSGDDGANTLKGLAGNDLLAGGGGDDLLDGGLGADTMVGGDGIDTASYANAASFVEASLGYGGTRGEAAGDSFSGVENISGSNWNDILRGDQGDNLLAGQAGNDTLEGGLGRDVLDGGTGTDQASYASAAEGVVVDLATGWTAGAAALGDTLVSIEDLGGSAYADTLTGNGGVNVLSGRDGDDLLDGGLGADSLDGGDGIDTATYAASASAVTINITTNDNRGGTAQGDTYSAIENIVGSRFNDSITGDGTANSLSGGDGDDRLEGLAGADTLDGGAGIDTAAWSGAQTGVTVNLTTNLHAGTDAEGDILLGIENLLGSGFADTLIGDDGANVLSGAAGDDVLDGRAGADSLVGGSGADTADYRSSDAGVTVSLTTGVGSGGTAEGDRLSGIENLLGSGFDDTLTGDAGANTLDGGAGIDTASYQPSTAGVTVSLQTNTGSGGMAEGDVLANIENLTGSGYADRLTGDAGVNVLQGLGGDDGIEGGAAADTIDGGAGTDTATYRLSAAAVTVDLMAAVQAGGDAEGDVLAGIENLTGSMNDDSLSGDAGANVLEGGLGADVLDGRDGIDEASYANAQAGVAVDMAISAGLAGEAAGDRLANIENLTGSAFADSLAGDSGANRIAAGAGDDLVQGGAGADTLDGGSGTDTAAYDRSALGVTVDLATNANHGGDAEGDVLTGVENLLGSSGADTLSGNAQANQLAGADGDDTLEGRGGADVIDGGAGTDTASYASSAQAVTVNLSTGVASGGDAAGDQLSNIENLTGSRFNDWLTGEAGTNTILAGAGNDTLRGLGGADVLSGGTGQDVALYDYSSAGVQVDLAAGTGRGGDAEGDVLGEIEDLIGSLYADSLAGNAGVNTLWGNSGDDVLEGRGGGDSFDGGGGSDTLSYSQSTAGVSVNLATRTASGGDAQGDSFVSMENLRGSEFADTLTGDSSANTIQGLGGNDLVDGGAAGDVIDGGDGTDRVTYAASTAAVRVDLALVGQFGGYAEGDQLTAIEDVTGSAYADTLRGNAGANALSAGSGDDLLEGRDGADTLDGGAGTDTATYAGSAAGVHVDMLTNANSGGEAEGDVLSNIEHLIGSSGDDFLGGTAGVNSLVGGLGDDVLKGAGGGDVIDGGQGADTASYAGSATGVFIDLKLGTITRGDATGDRFVSIENLLGSDLADTLIGDDGVNVLSGAGGDDLIDGGLGADTIDGGAGYDTASYSDATAAMYVNLETGEGILAGGWGDVLIDVENIIGTQYDDTLIGNDGPNVLAGFAGNDFIEGRNGADTLYGGYGIDTVSYETSEAGVTVNLTTNVNTGGDAQGDLLSDFENMVGSEYGDRLTGNNLDNLMHGLGGDDTLDGGAGNDTLFGDAGADYLVGGSGTDWVTYYASGVAVTIDLAGVSSGGDAQGDRYSGIDRVTATVFDDVIFGDASATQLQGMEGDDTIEGGAGADQIEGGSGNDTASYSRATGGVDARLNDGRGYGGDAYGDTLTGIENLTGSAYGDTLMGDNLVNIVAGGAGGDNLYGWGGDDTLLGQQGNDVIYGGAGADTLWGDVGDDWLEGQAGADIIDGASGSDTVSYNSSQAAVYVSLETLAVSGGDATGDTLIGIEHAYGSGYGDTLIGDLGANSLSGSGGNDLLEGLAGADRLDGGGDFDTATYARSDAAIRIDLASGTGSGGHAEGDTLTAVEGVIGSDFDDTLLGDAVANRLFGGAGSDYLQGRGGADTLNGGDGVDTASYGDSSGGVTVNLATGTGSGADAQGDVLTAVENLIGTAYADTLTGEAGVNVIVAAAGADLLAGLEGGDTLDGGSGIDTASYLASAQGVVVSLATGTGSAGDADGDVLMNIENLIGSQQADHLIGDAGDNRIEGRGGPDLIEGGAGNDIASYENSQAAVTVSLETGVMIGGDAQDDVLTGIENFYGSAFADTLIGDAGVNTLWGAAGDDLLEGLQGADRFDGGSGFDTATYVRSDAAVRVDLAAGTGLGGHAEGDSLVNVEKLVGSVYDDVLRGDGYTNHLLGGTGNDLIEGRGGADLIDGGDGNDTASYVSSSGGVSVNLTDGKGYAADAYGDVLTGIENLEGSSYGDVLVGDAGVNIIRGGTGNDDLSGRGGADTLDGGAGIDTANYLASTEAVTVNLETGIHTGGDAQDDLFISIENVTGSNFNDLVIGDAGANALSGEGGDDTLEGLGGADVLTGGAGLDTADYRRSGTGVIINLTAGTGTGGDAAGDTLTGVERVLGSSFDDTLIGDGGANQLYGNAGNDQLEGRGAGDYLDGGDGNDTVYYGTAGSYVAVNLATGSGSRGEATGDTIVNVENIIGSGYGDTLTGDAGVNTIAGGAGYDLIEGGAGADVLDGGASTDDTAAYYGSSAGVTVSLATGSGQGGDAEGDRLTGFENLAGSEFADQLEGDGADNALSGRDGDDLLEGLGGNDRLHGNDGNDTLDGGDGDDVLFGDGHVVRARLGGEGYYGGPHYIIGADSQPIGDGTVTWARETTQMSYGNRLYPDPRAADYRTLEYHAIGFSNTSDHSVTVTFDNDAYYGWWHSWYWGTYDFYDRNLLVDSVWVDDRRIDVYNTGSGPRMEYNGTLSFALDIPVDAVVDAGADTLIGGAGNDTLYGEGGADLLTGGTGNDSLFGGDGDDQLFGDGGNDTLWGNAGNDTASGGDGMDTFFSSQGADTFIGGLSWDTVDYAASAAAVAVDLTGTGTGGDAEGDRWTEIERVVGSAYNDQIHGDLTNDTLEGGGGNDVLQGRGGADSLIGGTGVDTASYRDSAAGVTVDIQTNANSGGDAAGDVLAGIENLTGSAHADWLKGDGGGNTLAGAAGDDLLEGRGGADLLDGGDGNDTAAYASSSAGVTVSLATGAGSGGDAQGDTLAGIENLSGSAYADTLTGDGGVNTLAGQAGDDRLSGLGGADTLDGGLGADTADYEASAAAVTVDLSVGRGWGGDAEGDVLVAVENLVGSVLDDRLTGDAGANSLEGGLGADVLAGGDGLDTAVYARSQAAVTIDLAAGTGTGGQAEGDILTGIENVIGSAYDDTFVSGADTATLNGGGGSDTVSYVMAAAGVTADLAGGRLIAVENMVGSTFADSLKGDAGANRLTGGEGDDTLEGRAGADVLSGGDGIDTAVYTSSSAGVTVNLATGAGSGGEAQGDQLSGIENLMGSALADTLIGDAGANRLEGGAGDDQFRTGGGDDVIDGGTGFDTLVAGGAYADSIFVRTATGWQVTDLAQGGTATLTGIEAVRFSDRTIYLDGRNNLPILVADDGGSTPEDTPIVITEAELLGNDSDFDGDEFVLWSVGGAQNGTVALDGFNNVTFTPAANYHGPASFTYTVRDSQGGYATQVVTLDIASVNDAPEAVGERTRAWSAGPQTFTAAQLKANDRDVDGDAFTIASVDNAAGGVASLNPDGSVTFTPISGFGGIGGFDYTLTDPSGATATARMSIYSPGAGGGGFGTIIGGVSGDLLIGADDATYQAASATFDAGDRLQMTIGSGGNRQKFIYSSWIKGAPTDGVLWADSYSASYNQYSDLYFSGGTVYVRLGNGFLAAFAGARGLMTQEWNHVFLKLDTTASNPADRLQLVVNGQSLACAQPISQNATLPYVNQAGLVRYTQFTGEMAEMHLLDGQNARASDFGTLAQDGSWVAKAYTGSHGATGVYLDFSNPNNPGADRSGNGLQMAEIGNVEVGGGFWGANGNDTLLGRDGGDTLIGNAGDDVLDGNAGTDTLIGGAGFDTYRFGRGYGADTVDNRGHAADGDTVAFGDTIDRSQLWLQRAGDDLEVSIIGTADAITIDRWYADAANHVSRLSLSDGSYLLDSDVDALVSAMAAMMPPPVGQTQLTAAEIAQLDPVLAASWRHD